MADEYVTRHEFDALAKRVDWIDEHGTRGVAAMDERMITLAEKIGGLSKSLEHHEQSHQRESDRRDKSRRFWITTGVAAFLAVETPIGWLIAHLH